jgi:PAS domain S-box-containing protein
VGRSIKLIIPPELHPEEDEILARLQRGERIEHYETVRVAKDGRRLNVSLTISPLRDARGALIGASKIARDITERKRAEAQLRDSEARFRHLVELLPVGVYTCEAPSGTIAFYNSQAAALWGRAPQLGDSHERYCGSHKMFQPDGTKLPHDECPMAAALQVGRAFRNQEVDIERPDGTRITALVNIDPIRDASGKVVAAINVFHDVTALKEAERQLKAADRRKDEFLATLAHELRNPLAPIRNGLHILRMSGQNGSAAGHVYEMMERQVAHMVRLVDDLLELSRISRGKIELKPERIPLAAVVERAVETSRPFVETGHHQLSVSLTDDPLVVEGDLVRLSQVFANLLNNAAKYTKKGGRITLAAKRDGKRAVVSVRDTGIGIPRDKLGSVFDMFAQVNNPLLPTQDGLGIGLNLVRTLVQMHGGSVEAKSDGVGLGSEFIVRLPLAPVDAAESHACPTRTNDSLDRRSVRRILCVDDNKDSADSLASMLRFLGSDVYTAYDGPSALEAVKICRPSIILMDLGMPGMDGCEVARRIRQNPEHEDMLLIAMTGWGQEEDRRRSREAGFNHHLVKPVDLGALQALLASREA